MIRGAWLVLVACCVASGGPAGTGHGRPTLRKPPARDRTEVRGRGGGEPRHPVRGRSQQLRELDGSASRGERWGHRALYAQIRNGAPFDVFLAADTLHPQLLVESEDASARHSSHLRAGRLVPVERRSGTNRRRRVAALRSPDLHKLGDRQSQDRALRACRTGNADAPRAVGGSAAEARLRRERRADAALRRERRRELGFIALSQARDPRLAAGEASGIVPAELHAPLLHDAVLLRAGKENTAARALLEFLARE